ncbi:MAG TPA: exo-alpha-sialidase, partial [Verrucomicrobiaceae bacterium]
MFLFSLAFAASMALPEPADSGVPQSVLDLAMEPAEINFKPGPEYDDDRRDFAMVIGADRTPKGRIWAAWVAGGDSDKGYFVAATSDDDGASWSKPRFVIHPPAAPTGLRKRILVGNLWCDPTGRMWLFYDQSMGYFDGRAGVWAITCDDPDAVTPVWSPPRRIWHGATLNKPVVLRNGEWLLPISLWTRDRIKPDALRGGFRELDDQRMAHVFVSHDQGATWTRRGGVVIPQSEFDEHMMIELNDGRLWMLARTKQGIAETFSKDRGRTWSEPKPSSIQNPSARFFLRRLASGHLLLVKNGPLDKRIGRAQMTAFISDDEGQSWKGGLVIDERNGVSYPDGFQSPDGLIHIIHDRERAKEREILLARFTEEDVLACEMKDPRSRLKILVNKATGPRIGDVIYNGIALPSAWPPSGELSRRPLSIPTYLKEPPKIIPIDVGRQLFVDDFLIEETTMQRVPHRPEYFSGNPVLKPEHPWESSHAAPFSDGVWYDSRESLFKMWYWAGGTLEGKPVESTCLATSRDGIHWEKPAFDVVPGTNIVLPDEPGEIRNSSTTWLDHEERDPTRRFKMFRVMRGLGKKEWHIIYSVSPDGIHWTAADESDKVDDRTTVFYNALRK